MHMKKCSHYHVSSVASRKWTALGKNLNQARLKWAELEKDPVQEEDKTFAVVAHRYLKEILPGLKVHT